MDVRPRPHGSRRRGNPRKIVCRQARSTRQAEAALEETIGNTGQVRAMVGKHRLLMHRLPQRPRLDADGIEGAADILASGRRRRRVNRQRGQPACRSTERRFRHEAHARQLTELALLKREILTPLLYALFQL